MVTYDPMKGTIGEIPIKLIGLEAEREDWEQVSNPEERVETEEEESSNEEILDAKFRVAQVTRN